jgi:hypothetical protein
MVDPELAGPLPGERRRKSIISIALTSLIFGLIGGAVGAGIVWKALSSKITNLENGVAYHEMVVENMRNIHWVSKDPDNYITLKPGDTKPCRPGSVAAGASMAAQGQEIVIYCVELVPRR